MPMDEYQASACGMNGMAFRGAAIRTQAATPCATPVLVQKHVDSARRQRQPRPGRHKPLTIHRSAARPRSAHMPSRKAATRRFPSFNTALHPVYRAAEAETLAAIDMHGAASARADVATPPTTSTQGARRDDCAHAPRTTPGPRQKRVLHRSILILRPLVGDHLPLMATSAACVT